MIYTVNFNPAVDYYLSFDKFTEGELNTPKNGYKLPGGKGINVSKVLKNYGLSSTCLGFIGGFTGKFIKDKVEEYGILADFIEAPDDTRINIKINNMGLETEVAGIAPEISLEKYQEFLKKLAEIIKPNDIVVLSGSVPKSLPSTAYKDIITALPKGVKFILDTRGEPFESALKEGVFLVKPNRDELKEYFKRDFKSTEDLIIAARELQKLGAENVIVSLGKEGSLFVTDDTVFIGGIPKGTLVSSVGAGDSMVAGFIYGVVKGLSTKDTYKFAIASGSATAFSLGLAKFETASNLLSDINIRVIGG